MLPTNNPLKKKKMQLENIVIHINKTYNIFFELEKYYEWKIMSLVSEVSKIKYDIVTNSLFNIHLILLFSYFHFGSAKTFFCV